MTGLTTTIRGINTLTAFWPTCIGCTGRNRSFSQLRFTVRGFGTSTSPTIDGESLFEETSDSLPHSDNLQPLASAQPIAEVAREAIRSQRFDRTFELLSNQIDKTWSKKHPLQVRGSTWIYLFDLATRREQLERVSSKFSQFLDGGRHFSDKHASAFIRRCSELHCPQLALTVFGNRSAHRMDLTATGARRLLYAFHEEGTLSDVVTVAALFPLYNLPALSSDPVSCALLISACLREANTFGSEPAGTVAAALLHPFEQLLSQTPPASVPYDPFWAHRSGEIEWMKHATLSVLDSLATGGQDTSRIRDWCMNSGFELKN
ncbi:hypothetical protein EDB86DRAFT_2902591 [Lactarius hatsudake]|nr:hypothetical protein EDB86DRAFT_2902591 [Lactarius hatsudake]